MSQFLKIVEHDGRRQFRPSFQFPWASADVQARAETLPFAAGAFDSVILYSVLHHVVEVEAAVREAARVLRPGGRLYVQESVGDTIPLHTHHFTAAELYGHLSLHLRIAAQRDAGSSLQLIAAEKPGGALPGPRQTDNLLVAIGITAQNREPFLKLAELRGQGAVSSAKLESGETMECDLVVAGIGVLPVAERLANSGIQMDNAEAPNFAAATAKSPAKAA